MSSTLRKSFLFLALALLTGAIGGFIENKDPLLVQDQEAQVTRQAIKALDRELSALLVNIEQNDIELNSLRPLWKDRGIGLVVYQNNRAVHWTSNSVPFATRFDDRHMPQDGIVKLKHSWYLSRTIKHQDQLLVGYALLYSDYDFENRYVKNGWSPHLKVSDRLLLTSSELETYPIVLDGVENNVGLRENIGATHKGIFSWNAIWNLVFLALILLFLWHASNWVEQNSSALIGSGFFFGVAVLVRLMMLWLDMPRDLYATELFGPTPHATSSFIPSLGDLILHLVFLNLIIVRFGGNIWQVKNHLARRFLAISLPLILIWPLSILFNILVANSSFSLDLNSPFSLNTYSLIGLATSFLGLLNYYVLFNDLTGKINSEKRTITTILPWLLIGAVALVGLLGADLQAVVTSTVSGLLLSFLIFSRPWLETRSGIYFHAPNVLVFSVIACLLLTDATIQREHDTRVRLARKLDQRQNPITEYLFNELAAEISSDRQLRVALGAEVQNGEEVLDIIHQKLSYDHWNRYQHFVDVFNEKGGLMMSDRERTGPNYFELLNVWENAKPTISDQLRYVNSFGTYGGYLAQIEIQYPRKKEALLAFISLIPERSDDILGFTDLFVDEEFSTTQLLEGYSYAVYQNGELQEKNGDFPYSLSSAGFEKLSHDIQCVEVDGYSHLVAKPMEERVVVVSRTSLGVLSYLTTFSYLFLFYLACAGVVALVSGRLIRGIRERTSFRNRINLAMSSVSFISLILIGLLTVIYVIREYNDRNEEMISEKSRSVLIELEHKLRDRKTFSEDDREMLSTLLTKFSKVFFTDINLYQLDGHLLATSRPRLFDEGMMTEVIDPEAYEQMRFGQRSSFIHQETIGNLNYLTAYVPFRNQDREVVAFMSLPYFARQYGLQQEIFSLLATLTNIYVFLILISVVLALFISNRITEPLRIIRESLRNLKLDSTNRSIEWKSNDEIGELVDEYNRTLNELVRSAELLARSERESAWREMAKQVAHEIKNPLTPMKLSIQMLQRSMADNADDLDQRIERTAKTLIEQIDTLSNIATEFSSFAQMPKSNIESVNLREVIGSTADLYKNSDVNISVELSSKPSIVKADREQLIRVFNNLIKNGIQATPEAQKPDIAIRLTAEKNQWIIAIKDKGSGIPNELRNKIFVPNFTTKSSGMGLGLAMVKNIIESANGRIWFESEIDKGTVFYISFPVQEQD